MIESVLGVFVITGVAMFFFFAEILIRLRGLGALIGVITIGLYFSSFLSTADLILVGLGFALGLALIIADGKFVNDGILGVIGFLVVLFSVAFAAPDGIYATYSIAGVILGALSSLILIRIDALPKRAMWGKLALKEQLTSEKGYNSLNESYKELVGKTGVTESILRPTGTVKIDEQRYSAVSNGQYIEPGQHVKVVAVDGTKILVEKEGSSEV
ncbi:membrane-bound ClpP family serine protease [Alkalibacillus filiformis]|uniref:Membrane-bound ClpP family serine protease n=1 Tax=Alkalibacillus filiformis TaxID=200990 RepID=A0ABU0DRG6_9BACI|nr:NfeD family protein [Alkalibacillus filiformis]MDQ0351033.1 membrane-bound ClpP family serine protease [Alkalibacillus filiformis]